jgi:phthiocerol/phenolphthiocerol synthesis type-I polyketide synthase E
MEPIRAQIRPQTPVAIIGMAARFPGAAHVDEFWRNLEDGVESLHTFSESELVAEGVDPEQLSDPRYVRKGSVLEGYDLFDAAFFGMAPKEAKWMDPQHRLLLECAWQALEDAGYACEEGLRAGVYAGSCESAYVRPSGNNKQAYQTALVNDRDFLAARISYKLGLCGPSMVIQSACSTGLVLVDAACQALGLECCDLALAGAVSVRVPQKSGHLFVDGMNLSSDGHCRPFDAAASGFRLSSGVAVVVLKRLADAVRDKDTIRAVVLGSAVTNDGAAKAGFTAPTIEGQTRAAAEAMQRAGVDPESIGYLEAQGSGTRLGDALEIAALCAAFDTRHTGYCPLGSVKGNVGNLATAAGLGALIKTVLALERKRIPPSLNFERPNPLIDFGVTPFFVNTQLRSWPAEGKPRRAGVHSYGVGGTNAHIVLEEAPAASIAPSKWPLHLMVLSAKTAGSLERTTAEMVRFLSAEPAPDLADVCFTLQVGRRRFAHRCFLVCGSHAEAIAALRGCITTAVEQANHTEAAFVFPAENAAGAVRSVELYDLVPAFRTTIDACGARADLSGAAGVFAMQLALARTWLSWGVTPGAIGAAGVGRRVADVLAGKQELTEALERLEPTEEQTGYDEAAFRQRGYAVLTIGTDASARATLECAGRLWLSGVPLDWVALHSGERRGRIPAPAYSFDSRRYWIAPRPIQQQGAESPDRERRPDDLNSSYTPPASDDERWLAEVWEDLLGIEGIGADDSFFELGGDSLAATTVLARIRDQHHLSIELHDFSGAPTIRQVAARLAALRWAAMIRGVDEESGEREEILI